MMKDDSVYSQEESSNFLSPFAEFRTENNYDNVENKTSKSTTDEPSLFTSNWKSREQDNENTSWLMDGDAPSDVSPIPYQNDDSRIGDLGDGNDHSYDDEDEESQHVTAPYRQALHHSMMGENSFFSETSFLLGNSGSQQEQQRRQQPSNLHLNRSGIHPMWAPPPPSATHDNYEAHGQRKQEFLKGWNDGYANDINDDFKDNNGEASARRRGESSSCTFFAKLVCTISGFHFFMMAVHDFYLWYLSYRLGYPLHVSPWQALPWVSPSATTLIQFGAFLPYKVVNDEQYWRFMSSAFTCTSLVEWALVCFSWIILVQSSLVEERNWKANSSSTSYHSKSTTTAQNRQQFGDNNNNHNEKLSTSRKGRSSWLSWCWLYLCCMISGQLWITACNPSGIAGGLSMGTCGVLCAAGAAKPRHQCQIYLICTSILLLQLLGTYTTIWGGIGACLTGWAFYGLGWALILQSGNRTGKSSYKGNLKKDLVTGEPRTGNKRTTCGSFHTKLLSGIMLLALWTVPTIWVGYYFESISQNDAQELQLK
eukprot:CAMPEP_0195310216 /NCGR_PEP_ID=MMETSP0707-20130614/39133_1 /TAXON_ID=33640 /ORGANISM="Asterionellopsis glacialis, Strain CCMP134" /LENGTH=537 /DNA_ID=CAMNT_0040374529 /DNA_START=142 /DNA_END=1755 /DNA_ORIENTATION=+